MLSTDVPTSLSNPNHSKFCAPWFCCHAVWSLIVLLGVLSFIVLAVYPSSHSENSLAFQGDTLYLASANGFWYSEYNIAEFVQYGDSNRKLQFITVPCQDLQTHNFQGHFQSRELYLTYKTHMLGVVDYLYLLPGSNVTYSICLWTNQTLTTSVATFFVFNSLSAYQDFVSDLTDGGDTSVMQQELRIGSVKHPACSQINIPAKESAYYFMSADCPGGVTYQYNITSNVKYLNLTDYETSRVCSVTEDQPCKLTIENNCFGSWKDICLLAYAIPSPPYSVEPPTTHLQVKAVKRYQVLIFPAALIVIGILGLLGVLLVRFCTGRFARRGYVTIQ